jgi:2,3-bisphosphoglycerate-dependent phosphoglycerate mutase
MPNIFFIRHGESTANVLRIFDNSTGDYPLSDKGIQQAEITAAWFAKNSIQAIYSSPVPRALETARIISLKIKKTVTIQQELKEFRIGTLEGQPQSGPALETYFHVLQEWRNGHPQIAFPGGETYTELILRFKAAIKKIIADNPKGNTLVVSHCGLIIFGIKALCPQADWETVWGTINKFCSITHVEFRDSPNSMTGKLIRWANTDHLPDDLIDLRKEY